MQPLTFNDACWTIKHTKQWMRTQLGNGQCVSAVTTVVYATSSEQSYPAVILWNEKNFENIERSYSLKILSGFKQPAKGW